MPTSNHRQNCSQRICGRYLGFLFILLVLLMTAGTSASARPLGPADYELVNIASVWLDGPIKAMPGQEISFDIMSDASGLFGAQLELSFDPAVLQVIGAQITPGSCPKPDFVVTNGVDNGAGRISYAASALAPSLPCDGGILASFKFLVSPAATAGSTQVQFEDVILANSDGLQIPASAVDLNLEILVTTAEFNGTPLEGHAPLTVDFTNLSSGDYDTCSWDFGDSSGSSTCENQSHVYTVPGSYTVVLNISGSTGSDSESKVDYIVVSDHHWLSLPVILK